MTGKSKMKIIETALKEGKNSLSEYESKLFLSEFGIPVTEEFIALTEDEAIKYSQKIGYPVVLKGSGDQLKHKTELDLISIDLRSEKEVRDSFQNLKNNAGTEIKEILVQKMIKGDREIMIGMHRDPDFGTCVLFGIGGIFTEIYKDFSLRLAPLTKDDGLEMVDDIKGKKILEPFRGKSGIDKDALADILITIGNIGKEYKMIKEIDINPLKFINGSPVAVDALIILEDN